MSEHFIRLTRHLVFWCLLVTAISLTGMRLFFLGISHYKTYLEERLSDEVGAPVTFKDLTARLGKISPELILKDMAISAAGNNQPAVLHLQELRIGVRIKDLLTYQDFMSSTWLTLVGAKCAVVRKQDGGINIEGLQTKGNEQPLWLLRGHKYQLLQSQITLKDEQKQAQPIILNDVDLAVLNQGQKHRINLLASLPKQFGGSLKVMIDLQGDVDKLSELTGNGYLETHYLPVSQLLTAYLPADFKITSGRADLKLWGRWQDSQVVSVDGLTQWQSVKIHREKRGQFYANKLDAQFHLQHQGKDWQVELNQFALDDTDKAENKGKLWPDLKAIVGFSPGSANYPEKIRANIRQIDIEQVSGLLSFWGNLKTEQQQLLEKAQAKGTVKNLIVYTEPDSQLFAVAGRFEGLSIAPIVSAPGIDHLNGQIKGSDKKGQLELSAENFTLKDESLFTTPLLFKQLKGLINWENNQQSVSLSSSGLGLDCAAFNTLSRFSVNLPHSESSPFLDLQMALTSPDMHQIQNYLPLQILRPTVKNWLLPAFVKGKITKGDVLVYGNLKDFPFDNESGVLEAKMAIDEVDLHFHRFWPDLENVKGHISYDHKTIGGLIESGQIGKVRIETAEAKIPELGNHNEVLTVKAKADGDINEFLTVLSQSPIQQRVAPFIAATKTQGPAIGTLLMTMPLWPDDGTLVNGSVEFKNAQLTLNKLAIKVEKLSGELKYDRNGVYTDDPIQARALAHPIKVNLPKSDSHTLVNVEGKVRVADIDKLFDWPETQVVEGEGPYEFQLRIPKTNTGEQAATVSISAPLEGFKVHLPGSLAKTSNEKKSALLTFNLDDESAMPFELNYNNELKAAVNYNAHTHKILSGNVLVGSGKVTQRKLPGLKIEVNRSQLPLQDWLVLAANHDAEEHQVFDIREIVVKSDSALWKKTRLGEFDLNLKREDDHWVGDIDSRVAEGTFKLPLKSLAINPIAMDMAMVNLSALKQFKSLDTSATGSDITPIINLQSQKTLWNTVNLGKLTLETQRTEQGLNIKRLNLEAEDEQFIFTGSWQNKNVSSVSHLNGQIKMNRADQFFDKLNITKDLTDTTGVIDLDLNWKGSPWQMDLANLQGQDGG